MKDSTKSWLEFAEQDLHDANVLFKNKSYKNCVLLCHQAIEKMLKAVIDKQGITIRKTHDLAGLLKDSQLRVPEGILKFIEMLNPHYIPTKYPELVIKKQLYNKKDTTRLLKMTQEVYKWLHWHLIQGE